MNKQNNLNEVPKNFANRIIALEEMIADAACGQIRDIEPDIEATDEADVLTSIEVGISLLIADLGDEAVQKDKALAEKDEALKRLEDTNEKLRIGIEELSIPIVKMWDKVLVLPLVGVLDTRRSQKLTETLLLRISDTGSRVAILDITGVPTVDSAVANHLMKTVAAVRLLGADCVISGIKPEVAQTIVHLGVDLVDIETLSSLDEALKWAFSKLGITISTGG